jgi:superfamily II DNA or RNA helicase
MELRDYQIKMVNEVRAAMGQGVRRVLMQSPTGSGKTATFCHIVSSAESKGKTVLVLAHRQELIIQSWKTLKRYGIDAGVIMAGYKAHPTKSVQVASIQTLVRRLNHKHHDFDLIVYDEAHHARSSTSQKVFDRWPNAYVLGVTATPCRTDGKGLSDVFNTLIHGPQIAELIEMGFLVAPEYVTTPHEIDLSGVKITAGDYNRRQLAQAVRQAQIHGDLVSHWMTYAKGLQTIVFAVDCEHSRSIVDEYNEAGVVAAHVDGDTPSDERKKLIKSFSDGHIKILSNVGIFTEGFDLPEIACVQIARPTKSVSFYFQCIGRALRPANGKTKAIVLDHAGVYHDLGSVAEPRTWELTGTKKKREKEAADQKEESSERIVEFDGTVRLVKVENGDTKWLKDLSSLLKSARDLGRKKGWVSFRFVELYPDPTDEQLKVVARALGYHWKWAMNFRERLTEKAA